MFALMTGPGALLVSAVIAIAAFAAPISAESPTTPTDAAIVSFTAPDSITEGEPAVFTFTRVGDPSDALALNLDFFFDGEFLLDDEIDEVWFAAGEAETVLSIPTEDDSTAEADGYIGVHLQLRYFSPDPGYPQPYYAESPVYQQVVVKDNDSAAGDWPRGE